MLLYSLDLFGTAVFAVSGAWLACRKEMDIFGALVLAFVTAVGGGTIRDLLIGSIPVFWIKDTLYLLTIIAATAFAILVRKSNRQLEVPLLLADALGLAVFVVIGVSKALSFGLEPIVAVMMGILTGCGGGAIRDVLAGDVPGVLRQEIYASAAMVGGATYIVLTLLFGEAALVPVLSAAVVLAMRLLAVYKRISLPRFILP